MAQNITHFAPDLTDGQLLEALDALGSSPELADATLQPSIVRLGKPFWNPGAKAWKSLGKMPRIGNTEVADLQVISSFSIRLQRPTANVILHFSRDPTPGGPSKFIITVGDGDGSDDLATVCLVAAKRAGLISPRVSAEGPILANASIQALSEQVASLRELVRTQARNNETTRAQLETEYQERRAQLNAEAQTRWTRAEAELAERKERLDNDLHLRESALESLETEKKGELQDQEDNLKKREESLDLQGEREERRRLRRSIQETAKAMFDNPDLSEEAKNTFARVTSTCKWIIWPATVVLVLTVFVPPLIEHFVNINTSSGLVALSWSLRAFAGIALTVTLTYYVRALSAWSRQVTSLELRSKQFALDIDRASWLVEMNLEYEKEGKVLRDNLIESFSRGLFEGESRSEARAAPSTSLLHLLKNAESLKIGAAGAEMSITGSQIRKADNQAQKAGES